MKPPYYLYKYSFTFIFILFCYYSSSFAQCIADAGHDTTICVGLYGLDSNIFIGGTPTALNGTPPYNYTWSCDYWIGGTTLHLTASDFLDDTTVANPKIIDYTSDSEYLIFYLTVTDSSGTICTDSINVRFSFFIYSLLGYYWYIEKGDSVQFYGIKSVGGGIPPLSFTWSPTIGLSDANDLSAWANPDSTTNYALIAIDSAGCKSAPSGLYSVFVYPVGIHEKKAEKYFNIFPNPASENAKINFSDLNTSDKSELIVENIDGKVIRQYSIPKNKNEVYLNTENLSDGIYFISFYKNGILEEATKIIVKH